MTVTFYSNYLTHHQIPFCNAMYELLGNGFTFVETEQVEQERRDLGWSFNSNYPYCLSAYKSEENYSKSIRLASESDIIIHGSASEIYMKIRRETGKPAFRYSERLFKRGLRMLLNPRTLRSYLIQHTRYRHYPLYMLCASAYTSFDCKRLFAYPEKCFKWGYFTEFKNHNLEGLLSSKNSSSVKILWAGRFIGLKHPEAAIGVGRYLTSKNIDYTMYFIGDGEHREQLQKSSACESDRIKFLGTMNPSEVRLQMEISDIFLLTSDFQEGWGAVLNEAMNSGCAVVASHAAGAVRFLLRHGANGFIYESGDTDSLCKYVELLATNPDLRRKFGAEAYKTIKEEWNPHIAASRLISLCNTVLENRNLDIFKDGPCSKAVVIRNKDYSF